MTIFLLIIATVLTVAWLVLLGRASCADWNCVANAKVLDNRIEMRKLMIKSGNDSERLSMYSGITLTVMKFLAGGNINKKHEKLKQETNGLQSGSFKGLNPFVLPGYVLQREIEEIGKSGIHKTILTKCSELYGKKYAPYKTKQLLAKMLSYPIIGTAFTLIIAVLLLGAESTSAGVAVLGIGKGLIFVLVYAIYDELSDLVKKRQNAIIRQFPGVVSKLALLVTSGMIMDTAWKETAFSQELELYIEMRRTSKELDNLVSPQVAYSNFINRCNTKESAKLASAIMQNLSKGNKEIGRLLKDMAYEAWRERRHTAKRDAEKANSKLMIPTMLLFLAILVMLMVPIAMNFSGL
ncbi:MAG: type II secretion system F family protein [Oscillospiraceae bacterium]|nr:type II secretion system F family protein [Oscillospiraceae bacterium]